MPRKSKDHSSPPTLATSKIEHRTLDDFAPSGIPPRSFFAGEYLRLAKECHISVGHSEDGVYLREKQRSVLLPVGTSVEYDYDMRRPAFRTSQELHKCHVTIDGVTVWLYLSPDEIEVVRPI